MSNFLAGLGAALLEGSRLSGRHRLEAEDNKRAAQRQEMELARAALAREQFGLQQESFGLQKQQHARSLADDVLEQAGPTGVLDDTAAAQVEAGGLGFRLGPSQDATISSTQFAPSANGAGFAEVASPGQQAGRTVIPSFEQDAQMKEQTFTQHQRDQQAQFQQAIADPKFYAAPREQRQAIWTRAGMPGEVPETFAEAKRMADYQHGLDLGLVNAREAATTRSIKAQMAATGGGSRGGQSAVPDAYGAERNTRIREALADIEKRADLYHVGIAGLGRYVPGTPQRDLAADLDFLKSNIGFKELQEMRAASKTGGALGQVSDTENRLLQAALGSIDQMQSPENFQKNIRIIRSSLDRWEAAKQQHGVAAPMAGAASTTVLLQDPNTGEIEEVPVSEAQTYISAGAVLVNRGGQ